MISRQNPEPGGMRNSPPGKRKEKLAILLKLIESNQLSEKTNKTELNIEWKTSSC